VGERHTPSDVFTTSSSLTRPSSACTEVLAKLKELEAIPGLVTRLLQTLDDPKASVNLVGAEISRDQALLAIVLRTANSAYYKSSGQVRDITEATVVLGYETIRQLVLGQLSRRVLRRHDAVQKRLWRHSLASAIAAQSCARAVKGITVTHAFTGALLHDIGSGVLHEAFPDAYTRLLDLLPCDVHSSIELEREHFGTDHAEIGAELLRRWEFPVVYQRVARLHHSPPASAADEKERRLFAMVVLSDAVVATLDNDSKPSHAAEADLESHPMLQVLEAGPSVIKGMQMCIEKELSVLAGIFG
jgi:putative nucleotidyltransferase with HDIG domain